MLVEIMHYDDYMDSVAFLNGLVNMQLCFIFMMLDITKKWMQ